MPDLGEEEGALEAKEQALAIFRELGDLRGECALLNNIGNTLVSQRRLQEATARFQEAIRIAQRLGSLIAEGHPTCNLGRAYAALGYEVAARECLDRALTIFRQARRAERCRSTHFAPGRRRPRTSGASRRPAEALEEGLGAGRGSRGEARPARVRDAPRPRCRSEQGDEATAHAPASSAPWPWPTAGEPTPAGDGPTGPGRRDALLGHGTREALPILEEACATADDGRPAPPSRARSWPRTAIWATWLLGERRRRRRSLAERLAAVVGTGESCRPRRARTSATCWGRSLVTMAQRTWSGRASSSPLGPRRSRIRCTAITTSRIRWPARELGPFEARTRAAEARRK